MEWKPTEAFALIGGSIDEDFGTDDVAKGEKHLHQLRIPKLLRQVVDEQVATFRSRNRTTCSAQRIYFTNANKKNQINNLFSLFLTIGFSFPEWSPSFKQNHHLG